MQEPKRLKSSLSSWLLTFAMASGTAGLLTGCQHEPAVPATPTECLDQIRVRGLLAGLARRAAELGRFDPYVYPVDGDPSAPSSGEPASLSPSLLPTLTQLRADPQARTAFEANLSAAKQACPEDSCAKRTFPTKVTRSARFGELREVYEFAFTGDSPPRQVLSAFETAFTYNGPEGRACTTPPAVDLNAMLIFVSSDNCDSDWPLPNENDSCRPPTKGHWKKDGRDLCCRT